MATMYTSDAYTEAAPAPGTRKTAWGWPLGILLVLTLVGSAFLSGVQFGREATASAPPTEGGQSAGLFSLFASEAVPDEDADLSVFWEVWNLMDEKFVAASATEPVLSEERIHGATAGMVASFDDPYTVFLPPKDAESFNEDIAGNFGGVGMEVGMRDGVVTVISPLPDTPAENAGLVSGDVIVRIDGESTEDMTIDEAVQRIRGEKGTDVILSIYREGDFELRDITVTRDTITIPTVETERVDDDIFVIRLYSFNALAEMRMQEALREYVASGADKLILDLRGNPGGYLQSAVSIASFFLDTGKVVVREQISETEEKLFRSQGRTLRGFAPSEMVVLIDGGSASASEILAGALREHDIATLLGATTFGKGSVQELVQLSNGSSLKVTVARWLTPDGTSISQGGLNPDIAISRTPEERLEGEDPQFDAAVSLLQGEEVVSEDAEDPFAGQ